MAIPTATPALQVVAGLRAWANSHDPHVGAAVELPIRDGWPGKASFRAVIRRVTGMYVIRWSEARAAFDAGALGLDADGTHARKRLDLAIAIGENRYGLSTQGPAAAQDILDVLTIAMSTALRDQR